MCRTCCMKLLQTLMLISKPFPPILSLMELFVRTLTHPPCQKGAPAGILIHPSLCRELWAPRTQRIFLQKHRECPAGTSLAVKVSSCRSFGSSCSLLLSVCVGETPLECPFVPSTPYQVLSLHRSGMESWNPRLDTTRVQPLLLLFHPLKCK